MQSVLRRASFFSNLIFKTAVRKQADRMETTSTQNSYQKAKRINQQLNIIRMNISECCLMQQIPSIKIERVRLSMSKVLAELGVQIILS